ncbi:MAG: hypothetical protein QM675_08250 [Protaetiibacter sp.]
MSDAQLPVPPTPYPPAPPSAPAGGNPASLVSFVLGIAAVAVGLLCQVVTVSILHLGGIQLYAAVTAMVSGLVLLIAAAALVVGLVAARHPGDRLRAGIGVGIGIAVVVSVIGSFALNGLLALS